MGVGKLVRGDQGVEGWSKKEKGLLDMDNSCLGEGDIRELNGSGKI